MFRSKFSLFAACHLVTFNFFAFVQIVASKWNAFHLVSTQVRAHWLCEASPQTDVALL